MIHVNTSSPEQPAVALLEKRQHNRMETVEQCARVMLAAELLGGPHLLPRAEVQKLIADRTPRVSGLYP